MSAHDTSWSRWRTVALWTGAYLYGSAPLVYWLGKRAGVDLRQAGSGNVGATNLLQHGVRVGNALALAGWIFDASKGAAPSALAVTLGAPPTATAIAGALGVAGQCWPVTLRFQGGRGISAFVGAAALMDPVAWAWSLLPMIAGALWRVVGNRQALADTNNYARPDRSRSVPLGCFIATVVFPLVSISRRMLAGPREHSPKVAPIAPLALSAVILLRRLTASLPDDASAGPRERPSALLYRLLYDRNTRD
ncbi:MAG TPA: glycerol-3-phosphate acyltransferase [Ktedonobacterales bacterium]|jgi:acyl-phosphate glycerol 3-phosphate acyltransferase|nr:glycerol-3-phosphate acyltransferase [Ktedonobacterales bacterium]